MLDLLQFNTIYVPQFFFNFKYNPELAHKTYTHVCESVCKAFR